MATYVGLFGILDAFLAVSVDTTSASP